ncbi:MAG: TIGR00266 family protein [Candidatus Micrarchaeota archaeon]
MKYKIEGTVMQVLTVQLNEGEEVYSESGAMSWMTGNVDMHSSIHGGIGGGLGRMFSGESLFTVRFSVIGKDPGSVTFSPSFPGKILPIKITPEKPIICQKDSFLAAQTEVAVKTVFKKKLTVGFFGGEGFSLQKLTGSGMAFVEIDGEVSEIDLKEGEILKVDTGSLAMFEPTVDYDVTMVKGVRNIMFGGEGMFLAVMKGPGKVWLQTMPATNLAQRLLSFMQKK